MLRYEAKARISVQDVLKSPYVVNYGTFVSKTSNKKYEKLER